MLDTSLAPVALGVVVYLLVVAVALVSNWNNVAGTSGLSPKFMSTLRKNMHQAVRWHQLASQDTAVLVALSHNNFAQGSLRLLRRLASDDVLSRTTGIDPREFAQALEDQQQRLLESAGHQCAALRLDNRFAVNAQ